VWVVGVCAGRLSQLFEHTGWGSTLLPTACACTTGVDLLISTWQPVSSTTWVTCLPPPSQLLQQHCFPAFDVPSLLPIPCELTWKSAWASVLVVLCVLPGVLLGTPPRVLPGVLACVPDCTALCTAWCTCTYVERTLCHPQSQKLGGKCSVGQDPGVCVARGAALAWSGMQDSAYVANIDAGADTAVAGFA
jgi:hypothetical protein